MALGGVPKVLPSLGAPAFGTIGGKRPEYPLKRRGLLPGPLRGPLEFNDGGSEQVDAGAVGFFSGQVGSLTHGSFPLGSCTSVSSFSAFAILLEVLQRKCFVALTGGHGADPLASTGTSSTPSGTVDGGQRKTDLDAGNHYALRLGLAIDQG